MSKIYQHINPTDALFNTITELDYIDDTDPSFILYYFTDGSKCNPAYIGQLNDATAFDKHMEVAEISSPQNKWVFDTALIEAKQTYAKDANGEDVLINDPYVGQQRPKEKIILKSAPYRVTPMDVPVRKLSEMNTSAEEPEVKIETPKADPDTILPSEFEEYNFDEKETVKEPVATPQPIKKIVNTAYACIDLDNMKEVVVKFNGVSEKITASDLINKLYKSKPAEQVIDRAELPMKATAEQIKLLDSMFKMAKKDACEISMNIKLNIPSESLYKLIANDYQDGLSEEFIKMIANKISISDLRHWVAAGLNAYYKGDVELEDEIVEEIAEPVQEELPEVKVKTKRVSKKAK